VWTRTPNFPISPRNVQANPVKIFSSVMNYPTIKEQKKSTMCNGNSIEKCAETKINKISSKITEYVQEVVCLKIINSVLEIKKEIVCLNPEIWFCNIEESSVNSKCYRNLESITKYVLDGNGKLLEWFQLAAKYCILKLPKQHRTLGKIMISQ
jgi:hypothetical protein